MKEEKSDDSMSECRSKVTTAAGENAVRDAETTDAEKASRTALLNGVVLTGDVGSRMEVDDGLQEMASVHKRCSWPRDRHKERPCTAE
jgi:hypothetical protein